MKSGVDIVVATPGRLRDFMEDGVCFLSEMKLISVVVWRSSRRSQMIWSQIHKTNAQTLQHAGCEFGVRQDFGCGHRVARHITKFGEELQGLYQHRDMKAPHSACPAQCPFCKTPNYAMEYHGAKTLEEKGIEKGEREKGD
eukprot:Gb_39441 [translate_table: standard]